MAYDEGLAERIRGLLQERGRFTEKKMFGGLAFLKNGNMTVGIVGDELMARVGPEDHPRLVREPHARAMDFTGRPMKGLVFVSPEGFEEDEDLERWVDRAVGYVATLPDKKPRDPAAPSRTTRRRPRG